MNNVLTQDDLSDLAAVKAGATNPDGSRRNLRKSELDDHGERLRKFGLAHAIGGHLELMNAGAEELEARGL